MYKFISLIIIITIGVVSAAILASVLHSGYSEPHVVAPSATADYYIANSTVVMRVHYTNNANLPARIVGVELLLSDGTRVTINATTSDTWRNTTVQPHGTVVIPVLAPLPTAPISHVLVRAVYAGEEVLVPARITYSEDIRVPRAEPLFKIIISNLYDASALTKSGTILVSVPAGSVEDPSHVVFRSDAGVLDAVIVAETRWSIVYALNITPLLEDPPGDTATIEAWRSNNTLSTASGASTYKVDNITRAYELDTLRLYTEIYKAVVTDTHVRYASRDWNRRAWYSVPWLHVETVHADALAVRWYRVTGPKGVGLAVNVTLADGTLVTVRLAGWRSQPTQTDVWVYVNGTLVAQYATGEFLDKYVFIVYSASGENALRSALGEPDAVIRVSAPIVSFDAHGTRGSGAEYAAQFYVASASVLGVYPELNNVLSVEVVS